MVRKLEFFHFSLQSSSESNFFFVVMTPVFLFLIYILSDSLCLDTLVQFSPQ